MALALFYDPDTRELHRMVLDVDKTFAAILKIHHTNSSEAVAEMDRDIMPSIDDARQFVLSL